MKLYSTEGPAAVYDPETETMLETDPVDDSIIASDTLTAALANIHVDGKKLWEDEVERDARLTQEELDRRRDPATLLEAVTALRDGTPVLGELTADQLREAEDMRKQIKAEREAEAEADREKERARLEEDARILAERQRIADENKRLDEEEAAHQAAVDAAARDASVEAVAADQADATAEAVDNPPADGATDAKSTDLTRLTRPELDDLAAQAGVEDPASLPNKEAVIAAIGDKSAAHTPADTAPPAE